MNIAGLIETFYKRTAQRICIKLYEATSKKCERNVASTWRKNLFDNMLIGNANIATVSHDFYSALDIAESRLVADTKKTNISFSDYYIDSNILDWNRIIVSVISSNEKLFMKCKDSEKSRASVIDRIQKNLKQKISMEYIATLLYYKLNHCYYDKTIFLAFRGIVRECTENETSNIFTTKFSNTIHQICQDVADKSSDEVYDSIFEKNNLSKKYKPNRAEFRDSINSYSLCCLTHKKHKCYPIQLWYLRSPYYDKVKEKIQSESNTVLLCSVTDAYENFRLNTEDKLLNHPKKVDKIELSEYDYRQLLIKYLPLLAGINQELITQYVQKAFQRRCLLKTMIDDLNDTISITFRLYEQIYKPRKKRINSNITIKRGAKYAFSSRFEMIHSLSDILDMDLVINCFFEIFYGILDKDSYAQFIREYKEKTKKQDMEEIKAIHLAAGFK